MEINTHNADILLSAANKSHYPQDEIPEVALAGRSNVGKSSFIIHFPIYYCQLLLFLSMYYFKIIYNQLKPVVNYYIAPLQYM